MTRLVRASSSFLLMTKQLSFLNVNKMRMRWHFNDHSIVVKYLNVKDDEANICTQCRELLYESVQSKYNGCHATSSALLVNKDRAQAKSKSESESECSHEQRAQKRKERKRDGHQDRNERFNGGTHYCGPHRYDPDCR